MECVTRISVVLAMMSLSVVVQCQTDIGSPMQQPPHIKGYVGITSRQVLSSLLSMETASDEIACAGVCSQEAECLSFTFRDRYCALYPVARYSSKPAIVDFDEQGSVFYEKLPEPIFLGKESYEFNKVISIEHWYYEAPWKLTLGSGLSTITPQDFFSPLESALLLNPTESAHCQLKLMVGVDGGIHPCAMIAEWLGAWRIQYSKSDDLLLSNEALQIFGSPTQTMSCPAYIPLPKPLGESFKLFIAPQPPVGAARAKITIESAEFVQCGPERLDIVCPPDITKVVSEPVHMPPVKIDWKIPSSNSLSTVTCSSSPSSGTDFAEGTTTVRYQCSDSHNQRATCSFNVEVIVEQGTIAPPTLEQMTTATTALLSTTTSTTTLLPIATTTKTSAVPTCILSDWQKISNCTVTCGTGVYIEAQIVLQRDPSDRSCQVVERTVLCNIFPCPTIDPAQQPQPCVMSQWHDVGTKCPSCDDGSTFLQTRYQLTPPKNGGAPCPNETHRRLPCVCSSTTIGPDTTTPGGPVGPPTNTRVERVDDSHVRVSWSAPQGHPEWIAGYKVEWVNLDTNVRYHKYIESSKSTSVVINEAVDYGFSYEFRIYTYSTGPQKTLSGPSKVASLVYTYDYNSSSSTAKPINKGTSEALVTGGVLGGLMGFIFLIWGVAKYLFWKRAGSVRHFSYDSHLKYCIDSHEELRFKPSNEFVVNFPGAAGPDPNDCDDDEMILAGVTERESFEAEVGPNITERIAENPDTSINEGAAQSPRTTLQTGTEQDIQFLNSLPQSEPDAEQLTAGELEDTGVEQPPTSTITTADLVLPPPAMNVDVDVGDEYDPTDDPDYGDEEFSIDTRPLLRATDSTAL